MKVNLETVKDILDQAEAGKIVPDDPWLAERRNSYTRLVGHTNPYYEAFYALAETLQPKMSVELGSYQATAASHLAAGYPKGMVYTVDIHREDKDAQRLSIEAAGRYGNLEYINGWTWDAHVVFQIGAAAADTPIDLLFIDAWHTYEHAMHEWEIYSKMLASEALIICDDIFDAAGATEKMVAFWKELSSGYESFLDGRMHPGIPMGFMHYER